MTILTPQQFQTYSSLNDNINSPTVPNTDVMVVMSYVDNMHDFVVVVVVVMPYVDSMLDFVVVVMPFVDVMVVMAYVVDKKKPNKD